MLILRTLQWGPQHGHGIGQAIRAQSDDLLKVETGSLYPALHRLVKRGWLKAEWGVSEANQRAKYYQLTAAGKAQLSREQRSLVAARRRHRPHHEPGAASEGVAHAARRSTSSTTRFAATWRSASRSASSAARIPRPRGWPRCREFGNVTADARFDATRLAPAAGSTRPTALGRDMRFALRSLLRAKGLAATVVVTLALGIGANAAIFSVVRGVLLRPLVNRDEDRLIYIRQSAPGLGAENMTFSVPEIDDFKSRVTTHQRVRRLLHRRLHADRPRRRAAHRQGRRRRRVVLRGDGPAAGARPPARTRSDDGPNAAGAAVLTYRFWTTSLNSDPAVIGKTIRLGPRTATVVGVLEPSVPYPADTEIIANVVTSPHHLGATMVTEPHASDDGAVRPARAGRHDRGGARRADGRARRDDARASRGVLGEGRRRS